MTTVWIYTNTRKEVGDIDHLKVFATARAAEEWFEDNNPLGVAKTLGRKAGPSSASMSGVPAIRESGIRFSHPGQPRVRKEAQAHQRPFLSHAEAC
jgi:hypothetical protein